MSRDEKEVVVRSVSSSQDEILEWIVRLHCQEGIQCDITYGRGCFYKKLAEPVFKYDINPCRSDVAAADSMDIPHRDGSLRSIAFDPPFLTYIRKGSEAVMGKRYSGYWSYEELEDHYIHTLSECYRVLEPSGILVFKCQDIIHNHKHHPTHSRVIWMAEAEGFRLVDLFVLVAKSRMPSPQRGKQRHARIFHSYFLVLKKP